MAYSKGTHAWGISDRSGFRYKLNEMKKEWTGALVGPDEWEPKHPQLGPFPRVSDPQALRNPRPDSTENVVVPPIDVLWELYGRDQLGDTGGTGSVPTAPVTIGGDAGIYATVYAQGVDGDFGIASEVTVTTEDGGPSPLPSVTNLLTEAFDFTDPAFELDSLESIQITSGIADPFGGTGAYRLADMNGFSYILQFYPSLGSGTVYYNDVWMRMVTAGGGTGLSADVGLYHSRLDWAEVTLTTNWNWYRIPRLGRTVGDNSWGINLQNNTVIEVYHARAFIDAYNGDPTYSVIEGPYA